MHIVHNVKKYLQFCKNKIFYFPKTPAFMFEPHINTLFLPHSLYSSELFIILTICLNEMHFSS